jgi:arginine/lysine/ornithine decarboxylase
MLHASTSPFYPLFAALDVNAKIHEGESGRPVGGVRGAGH